MKQVSSQYFEQFGYNKFGPLLLGFTEWLHDQCLNNEIKTILFLSRDGYIFKKAYDLKYKDEKTIYMYASRRSILVPMLSNIKNFNEIPKIIKFPKEMTIGKLLKKLGLEDINCEKILNAHNYRANQRIKLSDFKKNKKFTNLMIDLLPIIKKNATKEKTALTKYIDSLEIPEKVAIVDIGWYGTMQKALEKLMPSKQIFGYYLALHPYGNHYDTRTYKGYLFDKTHDQKVSTNIYSYRYIMEFLTLAQHGSVKRFIDKKDGSVEAELYKYEYESMPEKEISKTIHEAALKYVSNNPNTVFAEKDFSKPFLKPKMIDVKEWGNLIFIDGDKYSMAKPQKITTYIKAPKQLVADFKDSGWKIGFMKNALKINLPYKTIYTLLRKITQNEKG